MVCTVNANSQFVDPAHLISRDIRRKLACSQMMRQLTRSVRKSSLRLYRPFAWPGITLVAAWQKLEGSVFLLLQLAPRTAMLFA